VTLRWLLGVPFVCLGLGCTGVLDGRGGQPASGAPADGSPPGSGEPGQGPGLPGNVPSVPGQPVASCSEPSLLAVQMRRLTPLQHKNTLEAALELTLTPQELPAFQDDNPTIGLANDPQKLRVTTVSVDSLYNTARGIATRAAPTIPAVQSCISGTGTACFEQLAESLAQRLWRRPASAEEKADLLAGVSNVAAETGTRQDQAEFLLQALLLSPSTLYRAELGDAAGKLTDLELASLLSYTLLDSPPDATLTELALSGSLKDPAVLAAQAQRLTSDARFPRAIAAFLWDYLKLENVRTKPKAEALGFTPAVRSALAQSAAESLEQTLSLGQASLLDPFSGTAFLVNDEISPFFGLSAPGSSELSQQSASAQERFGILSHPAFLSVHAGEMSTSIVKRGVFVLEQLLGFKIPAPPANVAGVDPATIPNLDMETTSTRELLQITHSAQPTCVGCHSVIDPAGFGFENFDTVGRYRTMEKGSVPIDASGTLSIGGETLQYANSIEFTQALATSQAMRSAVLEHYFTYALGQHGNGCEAQSFAEAMRGAQDSVAALALELVKAPSFASRTQAP
jgi:hypothetical protein